MNYGSDIKICGEYRGTSKGLKYRWIAHANADFPDTIFINKHDIWFEFGDKLRLESLIRACSHETIHNILWYIIGIHNMTLHDRMLQPFRRRIKKTCKKTHKKWTNSF